MYSDSRLSVAAKLCQLSVLLLATASTASGYVDPAGPVITSPPDAGVVYLRDGTQDVSFWGYISESGTCKCGRFQFPDPHLEYHDQRSHMKKFRGCKILRIRADHHSFWGLRSMQINRTGNHRSCHRMQKWFTCCLSFSVRLLVSFYPVSDSEM